MDNIITVQEAIRTLKMEMLGDSEQMKWAKQIAIEALEKQIPKEPIKKKIVKIVFTMKYALYGMIIMTNLAKTDIEVFVIIMINLKTNHNMLNCLAR